MSRETDGYDFVQFIDGQFAILCKPEIVRCTKKCTLVQFFFGKVCKCHFFFVTLSSKHYEYETITKCDIYYS